MQIRVAAPVSSASVRGRPPYIDPARPQANAAWDCNRAIPDELMRQRVSTDYLRQRGKVTESARAHGDYSS